MSAPVKTSLWLGGLAVALAALNYQPNSSESPLVASLASDSLSPDQPSDDGPGDLTTPPEAAGSESQPSFAASAAPVDIDFQGQLIASLQEELAELKQSYDKLLAEKVALEAQPVSKTPVAKPVAQPISRPTYGTYYQQNCPGGVCYPTYQPSRGFFGRRR